MAIYTRGELSGAGVEIEGGDVMHYIQLLPGEVYDGVAGEGSGPCSGIDITLDDTGRCDATQLVEDLHLAQVAGEDDAVNLIDHVGISGRSVMVTGSGLVRVGIGGLRFAWMRRGFFVYCRRTQIWMFQDDA